MTICMGALCADSGGSKAVVVASDRMVTWANLIEFEHGVPKLTVAPPSAVVFGAGDALIANMLIERVVRAGTVHTVTDLANALSTQYAQMRQERAEADILVARGLNWGAFYGQHAQLQQPIVMMIDQSLVQYNLGVELLAAGVDDSGAHLFTVHNPGGKVNRHDVINFAAIGSGTLHALQSMIGFEHTAKDDLKETVFRVYASKRRAEVAPGVGKDTDLLIVRAGQVDAVSDAVLKELEELYREFLASIARNLGSKISKLEIKEEASEPAPAPKSATRARRRGRGAARAES